MRMILLTAIIALTGCATAIGTSYGPADDKGFGYQDSKIESDRFRVAFSGDGATPPDLVEDYALLRAAELTIANNHDWFRVVSRNVSREERGGVGLGAGVGSGSYGRRGGVNVGVGGNFGKVGARQFFTARLEILCGSGEMPSDDEVYDARAVVSSIRERTSSFEG